MIVYLMRTGGTQGQRDRGEFQRDADGEIKSGVETARGRKQRG